MAARPIWKTPFHYEPPDDEQNDNIADISTSKFIDDDNLLEYKQKVSENNGEKQLKNNKNINNTHSKSNSTFVSYISPEWKDIINSKQNFQISTPISDLSSSPSSLSQEVPHSQDNHNVFKDNSLLIYLSQPLYSSDNECYFKMNEQNWEKVQKEWKITRKSTKKAIKYQLKSLKRQLSTDSSRSPFKNKKQKKK